MKIAALFERVMNEVKLTGRRRSERSEEKEKPKQKRRRNANRRDDFVKSERVGTSKGLSGLRSLTGGFEDWFSTHEFVSNCLNRIRCLFLFFC